MNSGISDDALISSRTHKQQTTQQVTTVTKVVREVKHMGSGGGGDVGVPASTLDGQHVLDYVAMPLVDVQHIGPDGQPVDYVAMPLGLYPR